MTERQFIDKNKSDWERLEQLLQYDVKDADEMHQLFLKTSGDLSYAQTYFPHRSIRWYLNSLLSNIVDSMRTKSKINLIETFSKFYRYTLPSEVLRNKKSFLLSLIIFLISFMIGAYSTIKDKDFPKTILSSYYVEMTEQNIKKGDPMAVYKSHGEFESFFYIAANNLKVAFLSFVSGMLAGIGTIFILVYNGIMVGTFQTYFYTKDLLLTSMLSIWIHGTIEILSIIISAAAGLIIGAHLLFPKTYSRIQSLQIGAVRAIIIMVGIVPLIIIAAFFEGYLTRHTELPNWVKAAIILGSLFYMILIYVINPYLLYKKGLYKPDEIPLKFNDFSPNLILVSDDSNFVRKAIAFFREFISEIFKFLVLPIFVFICIALYVIVKILPQEFYDQYQFFLSFGNAGIFYIVIPFFISFYTISFFKALFTFVHEMTFSNVIQMMVKHVAVFALVSFLVCVPMLITDNNNYQMLLEFVLPFSIVVALVPSVNNEEPDIKILGRSFSIAYKQYASLVLAIILRIFFTFLLIGGVNQLLSLFVKEIINWHYIFDNSKLQSVFLENLFFQMLWFFVFLMSFLVFHFKLQDVYNNKYSSDISDKLMNFVKHNDI